MRKRSRLDVYLEVLTVIKRGVHKRTRIMYKTNLSWVPLMRILKSLLDQGCLRQNGKEYYITEKGTEVLSYFKQKPRLLIDDSSWGVRRAVP